MFHSVCHATSQHGAVPIGETVGDGLTAPPSKPFCRGLSGRDGWTDGWHPEGRLKGRLISEGRENARLACDADGQQQRREDCGELTLLHGVVVLTAAGPFRIGSGDLAAMALMSLLGLVRTSVNPLSET